MIKSLKTMVYSLILAIALLASGTFKYSHDCTGHCEKNQANHCSHGHAHQAKFNHRDQHEKENPQPSQSDDCSVCLSIYTIQTTNPIALSIHCDDVEIYKLDLFESSHPVNHYLLKHTNRGPPQNTLS